MSPITLELHGPEELRAFLSSPTLTLNTRESFQIRSDFLIECITALETECKYPYNSDVYTLARERLGLPPHNYDNALEKDQWLDRLVYDAQTYLREEREAAREKKLTDDGYEPFTQALIERAFAAKKKLQFPSGTVANVRQVNGQVWAMKPKARHHAYRPDPSLLARLRP